MSKPRHALTSLLSRLGVAGPARSRVSSETGAPSRSLIVIPLITLCALLALSAGVARAAAPGLVATGQFPAESAVGVAVDNSCSLHVPPLTGSACTAFDQSSGDVYVAGNFHLPKEGEVDYGHVNKFGPSGNLLSPPFGEPGAYGGAAVNPTNGHVYALKVFNAATFALEAAVETFDPATGSLISPAFPVPPSDNVEVVVPLTMVGIAADSAGDVYVPVAPKSEVLEYSENELLNGPAGAPPINTFTGGASPLKEPTAVAVDSAGNLWVADAGNGRIEELSPADVPIGEIYTEGVVQSVAVDTHGHVFATLKNSADFCGSLEPPCSHLVEYSSAGAQLFDFGAGEIGAGEGSEIGKNALNMVAVNDSTGGVYVTDAQLQIGGHGRVFTFAPPVPPKLESELAVGVTTSEAKLGALVNPGGIGTSYRFEYDTREYKEGEGPHGLSAPFPVGDAGAGFNSRTVWAGLSGLQPGTTYHYRVVVTSELGEVHGEDRTFTTETAAQATCPNEQFRTGFSGALPDCRAYELVTPPNKFSAQSIRDRCGNGTGECILALTLEGAHAAPGGNRLMFTTEDIFPGSQSGSHAYLATRGPAGWSIENEIPPQNYQVRAGCTAGGDSHSEDLSEAIFSLTSGGSCGLEPELIGGEPRGPENIYLRDNTTGAYQLINLTPAGVTPANAIMAGASSDFGRVVFTEEAQLTPGAPAGVENLYEWSAGHVGFVTAKPEAVRPQKSNEPPVLTVISADGSRVFFKAGGALYARVDGVETVQLDAFKGAGPGGGGEFLAASQDGSQVLFTDDASAALTADTVPGSATNLYLYDSAAPAGRRLTDLTPVGNTGAPALAGLSKDGSKVFFTDDASAALTADTVPGSATNLYLYDSGAPAGQRLTDLTPAGHAEVEGVVSVSEDGSSVYFEAEGVLTSQANQYGETPQSGQRNLYLWHGGATTFIAIASGPRGSSGIIKVSANGAFLALESVLPLTGYDNTQAGCFENACRELYLYDAAANSLACASCNPSGESPIAGGGAGFESRPARNLTENGRLFFHTAEALLPADTNGSGGCPGADGIPSCMDVYEFEPAGVGACAEPAGCLFLISTGTSTSETEFVDAGANGNDVFIREFQKLVPKDTQDGAPTVYDVHVDGGFPEPPPPPPCVTADACRAAPAPAPSIFGAPASQTFSGVGNLAPPAAAKPKAKPKSKPKKCRKGFVKKKGKCVKAKKAAKKASHNGRGK
jgi:NHL repeat